MFGSKAEAPTVIGRGAVIEGIVRVRGRVQLDGTVEGTLEVEGVLSVGPEGRVRGEVVADEIAVGGELEGKVTARKHLHVVRSGKVRGDVRYETLQIDRGAVLDGRTLHGDAVESHAVELEMESRPAPPALPAIHGKPSRASQPPAPAVAS